MWALPPRVDPDLALAIKGVNIVRFGTRSFHAGRAGRHPRNRKADHSRFFFQQTINQIRRNVPLNHIALNDTGVTRGKLRWDAVFCFDLVQLSIGYILLVDLKAICL